ncbi:hypothetical protein AcW1_009617 [Taiwanofungus camphoratus]|nr:hypothetical protein AcV7_002593 [Antrodia cinnamomea]KAI0947998.1 hypothetical protein AcW1_009617 [Antrodia cinnamomea]
MAQHVSPRVNSARLADYIGRTVRLTCKVIRIKGDTVIVEASDGGEVQVRLPGDPGLEETYVEFIGTVIDASSIKCMACINLGSELDMNIVNDVVELWHDPRFAKMV